MAQKKAAFCKKSEWSCPPIVTVEIFQNYLFAGDGNYISIYNLDKTLSPIQYYSIFPPDVIITQMIFCNKDQEVRIMVLGGNIFRSIAFPKKPDGSLNTDVYSLSDFERSDDSILAGRWLAGSDGDIVLIKGNNSFALCSPHEENTGTLEYRTANTYDGDPCILYSAELTGDTLQEMKVFVGTVFSKIDIYSLGENSKGSPHAQNATLLFSIVGHDGVIFSLKYYPGMDMLLSTSDDRKVIVWNTRIGENATIAKHVELYGHSARVFKAILVGNDVVSVGEDSSVIVWKDCDDSDKCVPHALSGHGGAAVRGCAYREETRKIYTCADNGSISTWDLSNQSNFTSEVLEAAWNETEIVKDRDPADKNEFPRKVCLANKDLVITTTDLGQTCYLSNIMNKVMSEPSMLHYQALSSSHLHQILAIGTLTGSVRIIPLAQYPGIDCIGEQLDVPEKTKVMDIFWLQLHLLVTTQSTMYFYFLGDDVSKPQVPKSSSNPKSFMINVVTLDKTKRSQVSAAFEFGSYVIVGYDNGEIEMINLFDSSPNHPSCRVQFSKRHTKYGVGGVIYFKNMITTGGRDGILRFFDPTPMFDQMTKVHQAEVEETIVTEIRNLELPFNWVGGFRIYQGGLLVIGFMSTDFVIYSLEMNQILIKAPCGGSHRSWDFHLPNTGLGTFVYLKDQLVHKSSFELSPYFACCVKAGVQKKQINCVKNLKLFGTELDHVFASGSEDCTVEVFSVTLDIMSLDREFNPDEAFDFVSYNKIETLNHHTSGVRSIAFASCTENAGVLMTGGGRSELFMIPYAMEDSELRSSGAAQRVGFNSEMDFRILDIALLFAEVPWTIPPPLHRRSSNEGRVMFAFVACSDGVIRFVREDGVYRTLTTPVDSESEKHSIQVVCVSHDEGDWKNFCLVHGATSGGKIFCWTVNLDMHEALLADACRMIPIVATHDIITGNSAICSMSVTISPQNSLQIVAGFDSGTLGILSANLGRLILEYEFTGSITGLSFNSEAGEDSINYASSTQTVKKYKYSAEVNENILVREVSTGIRDCQGMIRLSLGNRIVKDDDSLYFIMCFGDGLRVFAV